MATLLSLPVELQLAITSHLPPLPSSARPLPCLLALSQTCRHFHSILTPLVNSKITFSSLGQAQRYLNAPRQAAEQVGTLEFSRLGGGRDWPIETILDVLETVGSTKARAKANARAQAEAGRPGVVVDLTELRLKGFDCPNDDSSLSLSLDRLASMLDSLRSSLTCLDLETRVATSREFEFFNSFSLVQTKFDEIVANCFAFETLQQLRLSNMELTAKTTTSTTKFPWVEVPSSTISIPASSRLRRFELVNCSISDDTLVNLVNKVQAGALRSLSLRECQGLGRIGLNKIVGLVGTFLESLDITLPSSAQSRRPANEFSSPSSSSPHSSPPRRSSPLLAPQLSLEFSVDPLLSQLPNLRHLSLSGSLLSSSALRSLPRHCPHLRSISFTDNRHLSPSHLLPLLAPSGSTLPRLESLSFTASSIDEPTSISSSSCSTPSSSPPPLRSTTSPSPSLSSPTLTRRRNDTVRTLREEEISSTLLELSSLALSKNVRLIGKDFERIEERLKWAFETIEREGGSTSVGGTSREGEEKRRRKRPGICSSS
ncbi:hypothetical protein JCM16303_003769 [Sporobolomyces ruberrimus]